ncbi:putative toxin-antitoxin system toxin component, PIN family [Thomasclavelia cocleata]|uniref:putative toxin-antitoxin system toxin component, PIN family n=1 Tax=Thomasclavelia cocleata TaxID=69824 RepID=UPI003EBDAE96
MRIMLDTNVLISMLFFPSTQFKRTLDYITRNHKLVLSSFVIDELFAVTARKFPTKKETIDSFLSNLSYELVYTPCHMQGNLFEIRDKNDYPVLYTAIVENIDIFITGDKDFLDINVEMPEIMTPADFIERFIFP